MFQVITAVVPLQHLIGSTPPGTRFQLAWCLWWYNLIQVVRGHGGLHHGVAIDGADVVVGGWVNGVVRLVIGRGRVVRWVVGFAVVVVVAALLVTPLMATLLNVEVFSVVLFFAQTHRPM